MLHVIMLFVHQNEWKGIFSSIELCIWSQWPFYNIACLPGEKKWHYQQIKKKIDTPNHTVNDDWTVDYLVCLLAAASNCGPDLLV